MRLTAYNEVTSDITITPSTENLAYPRAGLYDTYGTQVFKFTDYTDVNIVFDAGSGNTIDFNSCGIVNHNFTSSATITIEGNATDSWGTPSFQETITYREYLTYDFFSSTSSYRYARLRIQDATNTVPLQIGYLMIGVYIQLPGFKPGVNITDTVETNGYISESGQAGGSIIYARRVISVSMDDFSNTQRQTIRTLVRTNANVTPCVGVLWESDFSKELPMFCVIPNTFRFDQTSNGLNNFNTNFTIREVL